MMRILNKLSALVHMARVSNFENKTRVAHLGIMSICGTGHGVMEELYACQPDHSKVLPPNQWAESI